MKVLLLIFVGVGFLVALGTWLSNIFSKKNKESGQEEEEQFQIPNSCCGAHEVCEFEEMLQNPNEIIYFEDEELDRFKGMSANGYNDTQIDEFRDVLYTLKEDEIKIWLLSIERRQIQLPSILRQEALMMVAEAS